MGKGRSPPELSVHTFWIKSKVCLTWTLQGGVFLSTVAYFYQKQPPPISQRSNQTAGNS